MAIAMPSMLAVENRVLRAALSRPWMIQAIPELETEDFWDLGTRLLWTAIRCVYQPTMPDQPSTYAELVLACAEWLKTREGCLPTNSYGLLATELLGERYPAGHRPVIDPTVLVTDDTTPDPKLVNQLKSDTRTLRFARRAREQMIDSAAR